MNCNIHVFYILIFSNKFGFILETVFSYITHLATQQPAWSSDSKSIHPSPTLTTCSHDSRLLSWLPPPSYFRDPLISTTNCRLAPFYIKHRCTYQRYLESGKASFDLDILDPR